MVQEQSAAFLKRWVDAAARNDATGPLGYASDIKPSGECSWEEVTFRLVDLGREFLAGGPLMAGHAGQFNDVIKDWSKRLTPSPEHRHEQVPPR